jgi:mRNA interferase HigB
VHIVSETTIGDFWRSRHGDADAAERFLRDWIRVARRTRWKDFADLKQTFGSADKVGDCVVFDVGNNRYRLIGRVRFRTSKIFILKVMDHAECDRDRWNDECGCFVPPPPRGPRKKGRRT